MLCIACQFGSMVSVSIVVERLLITTKSSARLWQRQDITRICRTDTHHLDSLRYCRGVILGYDNRNKAVRNRANKDERTQLSRLYLWHIAQRCNQLQSKYFRIVRLGTRDNKI